MEAKIFKYPCVIQEADLDSFGHLSNAVYLRLFEEARWQFISDHGFGIEKIQSSQTGPVLLEIVIRFMKELKGRDKVTICSQTQEFKGKVGKIRQWMVNEKNETVCEAMMTIGFWDMKLRKLIPATNEWLNAVGL